MILFFTCGATELVANAHQVAAVRHPGIYMQYLLAAKKLLQARALVPLGEAADGRSVLIL